jgi:hypothetical protein
MKTIFALLALLLAAATFVDNGGTPIMRGIQSTEDFTVSTSAKTVVVSGASSGSVTVKDAVVNQYTTATINSLSDLKIGLPLESAFPATQTITNLASGVCTFSSSGVSTYVGAGTALVNVSLAGIGTRQVSFPVTQTASTSTNTFANFASGSLGAALTTGTTGVNTLLSGLTPGNATQALYTHYDATNHAFTRNTSLFTGALDLSCVPAASNGASGPGKYIGCLVSARHMIGAAHATLGNGTTVWFCDNSQPGVVSSRTISSSQAVSGTDIVIYYLSAPVASGITFAKSLPSNYATASFVPSMSLGYGYPAIYVNQFQTAATADVVSTTSAAGYSPSWVLQQSSDATRSLWYTAIVSGDSGTPALMDAGGSTVLLGTEYGSNRSTYSYFNGVADNITAVNAAMTTLAGVSSSLTQITLSYSTY